jgi:hypothetical protein
MVMEKNAAQSRSGFVEVVVVDLGSGRALPFARTVQLGSKEKFVRRRYRQLNRQSYSIGMIAGFSLP